MPYFKIRKLSIALGLTSGLFVVPTYADDILFPYVVVSNSVTTLLSVVNSANPTSLHYRFYYKTSGNQDPCDEVNFKQPSSPNDIVTVDIGGQFGDKNGVLFEPTSSVAYHNFSAFKSVKPVRAFAIVDNNDNNNQQPDQSLSGDAIVFEFANGAAWGYTAYNALPILGVDKSGKTVVGNNFDFSDRVERFGEVLTSTTSGVPTSILPFGPGGFETVFFVTPIATQSPFQLSATTTATLGLRVPVTDLTHSGVMFDRDENPYSGNQDQSVTCVGRVDVGTLMSEATRQYLESTGGWTTVKPSTGQAVVFKLEYTDPSTVNPLSLATVNNITWLREGIRGSVPTSTISGTALNVSYTFKLPEESPYPLIDIPKALANKLPWPPEPTTSPMSYVQSGSFVNSITSRQ